MAKSKYTPEIVQVIIDAIKRTGSDKAGWQAGEVSKDTFYDWCKRYPDFSDQIKQAKSEYRETCPEALVAQAQKAFADYLFGRVEVCITTFERGQTEKGSYSKEITKRMRLGTPRWAIERVLGKPLDLLEAVTTLAEAGILPRWLVQKINDEMVGARKEAANILKGILPNNPDSVRQPGISEETAAAIRAFVLGIQPSSSSPLPAEMGSGHLTDQDMREVSADRS